MWRFYSIDTVSQQRLGSLDGILQSWQKTLNGTASAELDIHPDADGLNPDTKDDIRRMTDPVKRSLLVCWDDVPWICGPIWSREWDESTGTPSLKITVSGVESLWDKKKVLNYEAGSTTLRNWFEVLQSTTTPDTVKTAMTGAAVNLSGTSLGRLISAVIRASLDPKLDGNPPDGAISYPDLSTDTDASASITANYWDLTDLSSAISTIQGQSDAPDMTITPIWDGANRQGIIYRIDIGRDSLPEINSDILGLNATYGLPDSPIIGFTDTEDGTTVSTQRWSKGSGSDSSMIIAAASSRTDPTMPLIAGETDYTSISDSASLSALVKGDLASHLTPTRTLSVIVDGSAMQTAFGAIPLGSIARIRFNGHPWEPDGVIEGRVTSMSNTDVTGGPIYKLDLTLED